MPFCFILTLHLRHNFVHAFFGTMKASARRNSSASLPEKVGHDHGDFEELLLKKRHTQRAFEDGLASVHR